jgi:hypothetical protein
MMIFSVSMPNLVLDALKWREAIYCSNSGRILDKNQLDAESRENGGQRLTAKLFDHARTQQFFYVPIRQIGQTVERAAADLPLIGSTAQRLVQILVAADDGKRVGVIAQRRPSVHGGGSPGV